jgi:glycosyltransferase involved in cell wall biosynthesis
LSENYRVILCSNDLFSRARVLHVLLALGIPEFDFEIGGDVANIFALCRDVAVLFAMGNEIIPPLPPLARVNLYHLQFPFPWRHLPGFNFNLIETYDAVVVNSSYTQYWTMRRMNEAGIRRPPPIIELSPPVRKVARLPAADAALPDGGIRIVTVGRFFTGGHSKRQDVVLKIIEEARKLTAVPITATMIGAVHNSPDAHAYFDSVIKQAHQLDVEIIVDAPSQILDEVLQRAHIYLHCAGFGVAESGAPEKMEHFGISIVEAIQAGCIPLVYAAGGAQEVIAGAGVGFTFESVEEAAQLVVRLSSSAARRAALANCSTDWIEGVLEPAFGRNLAGILERFSRGNERANAQESEADTHRRPAPAGASQGKIAKQRMKVT